MAVFNYKQAIYAGMIAIAGVDGEVTSREERVVNEIFHQNLDMSRRDRKEVIQKWKENKDNFTDLVIEELKIHSYSDQKEAFKNIYHFILERRKSYNLSGKSREKGVDKDLEELNNYEVRADKIKKALGLG